MVFAKNVASLMGGWSYKRRVLRRAGTHRELLNQVRRRQMAFLGHVYRKDDVERQVLTGRVQGKRDRGRQRMTFLQSLRNWNI